MGVLPTNWKFSKSVIYITVAVVAITAAARVIISGYPVYIYKVGSGK